MTMYKYNSLFGYIYYNFVINRTLLSTTFICSTLLNEILLIYQTMVVGNIYEKKQTLDDEMTTCIIIYIILELLIPTLETYVVNATRDKLTMKLNSQFTYDAFDKYNKLSFKCKNSNDINGFTQIYNHAKYTIDNILDWGIPTSFNLIGTIISTLYIFVTSEMYFEFSMMIFINALSYIFITKKVQNEYMNIQNTYRKKNNRIRSTIQMWLPLFSQGEKTVKDIANKYNEETKNYFKINENWKKISYITTITNKICLVIIAYSCRNNIMLFLLMLNTSNKFTNSIQSITGFLNHFSRLFMDFNTFTEFWNNMEFRDDPIKKDLPNELVIKNINITNDTFSLISYDEIIIRQGYKILINGASGSGKTTFLNAFTGKIAGITLENNLPENYYHNMIEMYQKNIIPTSQISIRELFCDEQNDDLIEYCMKLCCISEFDNYDSNIDERISGGQRTRLYLAIRIHALILKKSQILILDEPEQGLGNEIAKQVLCNIFNAFPNTTIMVITHLCECIIDTLADWDLILHMNNGMIKKVTK